MSYTYEFAVKLAIGDTVDLLLGQNWDLRAG